MTMFTCMFTCVYVYVSAFVGMFCALVLWPVWGGLYDYV